MALVVHLRRGQQAIVNGAVLENASPRGISLLVQNGAAILRSDDILTPDAAVTPASRIYYALQCAYLFPESRAQHLATFAGLLGQFVQAAPSSAEAAEAIRSAVGSGEFYAGLKVARELLHHERKVLSYVESRLAEDLRPHAAVRQPPTDGGMGPDPGGAPHARGAAGS